MYTEATTDTGEKAGQKAAARRFLTNWAKAVRGVDEAGDALRAMKEAVAAGAMGEDDPEAVKELRSAISDLDDLNTNSFYQPGTILMPVAAVEVLLGDADEGDDQEDEEQEDAPDADEPPVA